LGLGLLVTEEAILPPESEVAEPKRTAAVDHDWVERVGCIALADAGAADPRHSHAHREVVRNSVSENRRGTFDSFEVVDTFVAGNGGSRERLIAERLQPNVLKHHPGCDLTLVERACGNGEDWAGFAGIPATTGVVRKRRACECGGGEGESRSEPWAVLKHWV